MAGLRHAGENKHFAGDNKVLKSINQVTAYCTYCASIAQRSALSACIKYFYLNHLLPRNFAAVVAKLPDIRTRLLVFFFFFF